MTDQEMLQALDASSGAVNVSMSKKGIWLRFETGCHEITAAQAEILWELLPLLPSARAQGVSLASALGGRDE